MNRLYTPRDWWKFTRNGVVVVLVATILFFWNSPHSADEIAVVIGTPLIIFNCIPFLFMVIVKYLPQPQPAELPSPNPLQQPLRDLSWRTLIIVLSFRIVTVLMIIGFSAGTAILAATFAYSALDVGWAILPARHLAFWLLGLSILPIAAFAGFFVGIYYAKRMRSGGALALISAQTRTLHTHWPTAA